MEDSTYFSKGLVVSGWVTLRKENPQTRKRKPVRYTLKLGRYVRVRKQPPVIDTNFKSFFPSLSRVDREMLEPEADELSEEFLQQ